MSSTSALAGARLRWTADAPPLTSRDAAVARAGAPLTGWRGRALLAAGWTAFGLAAGLLARLAPGSDFTWAMALVPTLATSWYYLAATPVVAALTRRAAALRAPAVVRLLPHLPGAVLFVCGAALVNHAAVHAVGAEQAYLPLLLYTMDVELLLYVAIVAFTSALDRGRRYAAHTRHQLALHAQLSRAQLVYLERQLQPHFLFNSLNAISQLTWEAPAAAARMLAQLRALLASALDRSGRAEVPLRDELATLAPYLEIQRTRFGDDLRIEQRVDADALDLLVPPLLLQPLVENAIQHGLAQQDGPGRVAIEAHRRGGRLHLAVRDNGPGPVAARAGRRHGIGLRNTRERLQELYGEDFAFGLAAGAEGGTCARIELPGVAGVAAGDRVHDVDLDHPDLHPPRPPLPPAGPAGDTRDTRDTRVTGPVPRLLLIALLWLGAALFWTYQMHFFRLASGRGGVSPLVAGRADMVSAAVWALLTPVVFGLGRLLPVTGARRWLHLAAHGVLAVVVAIVEIALVHATGIMGPRPIVSAANLNVFILDVVVYGVLVAWSHGDTFTRWFESRRNAAARLAADVAGAQWRARTLELRPRLLFRTLDAIAERVPRDARAADALILRFATVLRQLLDVAGQPTVPLDRELELLRATLALRRGAGAGGAVLHVAAEPGLRGIAVPNGLLRALAEELLERDRAGDGDDGERMAPGGGRLDAAAEGAADRTHDEDEALDESLDEAPDESLDEALDTARDDEADATDGLPVLEVRVARVARGRGEHGASITLSLDGARPLAAVAPADDETLALLQRAGLGEAIALTRPAPHVVRLEVALDVALDPDAATLPAGSRAARPTSTPYPLPSSA